MLNSFHKKNFINFFRLLYYSRNSLPVKGAEHITLKKPVCEQLLWWILVWNTLIPKLKNENGFLELLFCNHYIQRHVFRLQRTHHFFDFCNHEIFNTKAVDWRLSDPYQPQPWDKKWAKTHLNPSSGLPILTLSAIIPQARSINYPPSKKCEPTSKYIFLLWWNLIGGY